MEHLGWKRIGGTAGIRVDLEVRPGLTVNHPVRFTFHIPVWYWRHITGHYLAWFGRLYSKENPRVLHRRLHQA